MLVSFEQFSPDSHMPIYLQIVLYIKRGIVSGTVKDGDGLPSRRVLSALLGVNPNTVQKAYRMLEEEGLIVSQTGAKSEVSVTEDRISEIKKELLSEDITGVISAIKQMGLTLDEATDLIKKNWNGVQ